MGVIGAYILTHIQTWVDEEYTTHPDMHIHTGRCMDFAWGGGGGYIENPQKKT